MWRASLQNLFFGRQSPQPLKDNRRRTRLQIERLDDRVQPAAFTAGTVADLIADMNAANLAGGSNTITLVAGATFQLSTVNNTTDGPTGLPVITANNNLTISGNGDVILRSMGQGTPGFRLLDVAAGATLTLNNLTLQGGLAAAGGAVSNQGTLNMNGVIVQKNVARYEGGGICSSGTLVLQNCTIQNNQAVGYPGADSKYMGGGDGGYAHGGGIAITGGTANLTNVAVVSNAATGGNGGKGIKVDYLGFGGDGIGGDAFGGGIYVEDGSVKLVGTSVKQNTATGGNGAESEAGSGGGIFIGMTASVYIDGSTLSNTNHNHASSAWPDICGTYSLI